MIPTINRLVWPFALLLAACSPTHKIIQAPVVDTDEALLYVYRPASFDNIVISPPLRVDDMPPLEMGNNRCFWWALAPGLHRLQVELGGRYQGNHRIQIDMSAGREYYVSLSTRLQFRKNDLYLRRFDLRPVGPEQMAFDTAACKPALKSNPGDTADDPAQPHQDTTDHQFSIEKSRNPFGH